VEAADALEDSLVDDSTKSTTKLVLHEFWVLFRGSLPVIVAYTLQNSLQTVSVLIVGRLSPEALATAAFAYMFAMATGWLIALGGTTAIDTLASATFTSCKDPHGLGVILQRAFWILSLFYIPVAVLWICAEPVFLLLGQEAYLARDAARFLTVLVPGGLGYIFFECMKKFLQAQGPLCFPLALSLATHSRARNHEARHVRAAYHVTAERTAQLLVHPPAGLRAAGRAAGDWHQLLAVVPAAGVVRPSCGWLGGVGRVEPRGVRQRGHIRATGNPGRRARRHRVVGLRDRGHRRGPAGHHRLG
jgi:hypothetical protein